MSKVSNKRKGTTSSSSSSYVPDLFQLEGHPAYYPGNLMNTPLHPNLQFKNTLKFYNLYQENLSNLHEREIKVSRIIDWTPLVTVGLAERIEEVLVQRQGNATFNDWKKLFDLHCPVYSEWVMELLCTSGWRSKITDIHDKRFMYFLLGQEPQCLSMIDIARALGIYTESELRSPACQQMIEEGVRIDSSNFNANEAWAELSGDTGGFNSGNVSYSKILRPELRVIHRFLANSIAQRGDNPDKVTLTDLGYLRAIRDPALNVNIPYGIAYYLNKQASGRRGSSPMGGGIFVTKIGEFLKVNKRLGGRLKELGPPKDRIDGKFYIKAKVVEKKNGHFVPVEVAHESEDEEMGEEDDDEGEPSGLRAFIQAGFEDLNNHMMELQMNQQHIRTTLQDHTQRLARMEHRQQGQWAREGWLAHQYQIQSQMSYQRPNNYIPTQFPQYSEWTPDNQAPPPPYDPDQAFRDTYGGDWDPARGHWP